MFTPGHQRTNSSAHPLWIFFTPIFFLAGFLVKPDTKEIWSPQRMVQLSIRLASQGITTVSAKEKNNNVNLSFSIAEFWYTPRGSKLDVIYYQNTNMFESQTWWRNFTNAYVRTLLTSHIHTKFGNSRTIRHETRLNFWLNTRHKSLLDRFWRFQYFSTIPTILLLRIITIVCTDILDPRLSDPKYRT